MKRDTKRIEQLLANATASRNLVRAEIAAGASLQHVYDEITAQETTFAVRLKELNAFNAAEAKTPAATESKTPPKNK